MAWLAWRRAGGGVGLGLAALIFSAGGATPVLAEGFPGGPDPYLWLEQADSPRALEWVKGQSASTLGLLTADPRFSRLESTLLASASAKNQIAWPTQMGPWIFNFWVDEHHSHGVLRRVRADQYDAPEVPWDTVLDLDALGHSEGKSWVYRGTQCLPPAYERCLIELSNGGSDATVFREFDMGSRSFVPPEKRGFFVPESKSSVAWAGDDLVFVATDFGPGSLSTSGYPRIVKLWKRGTALSAAATVLEAPVNSVQASGSTEFRPEGNRMILSWAPSFFQNETLWLRADGTRVPISFPLDSQYEGSLKGYFLALLLKDWDTGARVFHAGSLVAIPERALDAPDPARAAELVYQPAERVSINSIKISKNYLYLNLLDHVNGRLVRIGRDGAGWKASDIALPDHGTVSIVSSSADSDRVYARFESYLVPASVYQLNSQLNSQLNGSVDLRRLRQLPAQFDASKLELEQNEAISADGTRIPYFIVHPKGMALDGTHPTILTGYGGFDVSLTPSYLGATGSVWSEKGGVYVVANIRGGGEFGPAWHDAAIRTHRQKAYDDFIAVAQDLIVRGITSPRRLGIRGGSNGGLLVGAVFVERPDLFNAVVCEVPLLDMARYPAIAAGASWIPEYGDPRDPVMWQAISKYSPYQNIRPGVSYPKPFIWTSTEDDRVGPAHARKMAAKMEEQGHPVLFYENPQGGHGAGAGLDQQARTAALEYSYLYEQLVD